MREKNKQTKKPVAVMFQSALTGLRVNTPHCYSLSLFFSRLTKIELQ